MATSIALTFFMKLTLCIIFTSHMDEDSLADCVFVFFFSSSTASSFKVSFFAKFTGGGAARDPRSGGADRRGTPHGS